ncbi:MAG: DNA primase [Lachnospiraceae bacterium]|nr:DNA primase [Lachnospiraceae bacterium]
MRYSEDLIQDLLARNNIVDIIGEHVSLSRTGDNYKGLCPFHNEKTPSFHVDGRKQMYYCFGCHAGGNVVTFLMQYNQFTFVESLKYLADRAGVTLPEQELSREQRQASEKRQTLLEIYKKAAAFYYYRLQQEGGAQGLAYLKGRGLSDETIRRFGLGYSDRYGNSLYRYLKEQGYADVRLQESGLFHFDEQKGVSDRFWNRVMYPIQDERGRVIGFGGRVMGDGKPKYLNSPESFLFNKRKHLYALNYARASRRGYLILCEGYMDVITMHQAGYTNACASLGTALTEEQCALMRRFTNEVRLIYDSDEAGINAALRALPLLRDAGLRAKIVSLTPYKDPDEFIRNEGAEEFEKRLAAADDAFLFELTQLARGVKRDDPAEWTAFQREAAARLMRFPDELERENYLEATCARFGIPRDGMRALIRKTAARGTPAEHYTPPKSGKSAAPKKEDRSLRTQKLMLTYLANYPEAYLQTRNLIGPKDFTDEQCRKIAEALYEELAEDRVSEAGLIAMFPDGEEQTRAAQIFHERIAVHSAEELDRAFTDTVERMLKTGNEASLAGDSADLSDLTRYMERKKQIEEFGRGRLLHLSWQDGELSG